MLLSEDDGKEELFSAEVVVELVDLDDFVCLG